MASFLDTVSKKVGEVANAEGSFKKDSSQYRKIGATTSFARVIYWHYEVQNFGVASSVDFSLGNSSKTVMEVTEGTLEAELTEVSVHKTMSNSSGSFSITVLPNKNWKQYISPGDWLAIYLYSDTKEYTKDKTTRNMVMFGNVDRVSRTRQREEDSDKIIVRYVISGRDFGKVFEDTETFFNPYLIQTVSSQVLLNTAGIPFSGNPSQLVNSILDVFLGSKGASLSNTAIGKGKTEPLNQWIIPSGAASLFKRQEKIKSGKDSLSFAADIIGAVATLSGLSSAFGQDGVHFDDIMQRLLEQDLPGEKERNMIGKGQPLWSCLKRSSNDVVNDLYCELVRDNKGIAAPSIVLRPHPSSAFFKDTMGMLNNHYKALQDYPTVDIDPSEIKYEDLGRDSNSRINMVWLSAIQSKYGRVNELANVQMGQKGGIGNPMVQIESIKRYGLKRVDRELAFVYPTRGGKSQSLNVNIDLYKSFLEQLFDANVYNHLYETGTMVSVGNNKAEIGKALKILSSTTHLIKNNDKIYYIEGYSHTWTFPGQWETEWQLTRGQFANRYNPFIDASENDSGKLDTEFSSNYLVKTQTSRDGSIPIAGTLGVSADILKGMA